MSRMNGRVILRASLLVALVLGPVPAAAQSAGRTFGVQVAPDAPRDTLGARITAVTPGSLAERLGLKAGDRILRMGRVDLVRHQTDPGNAATGVGRLRVALADPSELVPVLVWRDGAVLTGVGSWAGSVPVPLQDATALIGALTTLASQGMVPVESPGTVPVPSTGGTVAVPSTGGSVAVPSTGGSGTVPAFGDSRVPASGGSGTVATGGGSTTVPTPTDPRTPKGGSGGSTGGNGSSGSLGNREWRVACASLTGPRPAGKYFWLSSSGASSEMLWLNVDGSYSTQRSSAYSSYTEDGCFKIDGSRITFYKVASAAMASAPSATGQRGVSLGSASGATFEPRTVSFATDRGALVIGGDTYAPTTDR